MVARPQFLSKYSNFFCKHSGIGHYILWQTDGSLQRMLVYLGCPNGGGLTEVLQGGFFNWSPPKNHKFFLVPKITMFFFNSEKNRVPRVPKKTLLFSRWSPPSKSQVFFLSSWTLFFFEPFLPHVWDSVFLGGAPPQNHKFFF